LSTLFLGLPTQIGSRLNLFESVFLWIFIEALPYLLIGTLISGLVEVFLNRELIAYFISKRSVPIVTMGALIGLVFQLCECDFIPFSRACYESYCHIQHGGKFRQ